MNPQQALDLYATLDPVDDDRDQASDKVIALLIEVSVAHQQFLSPTVLPTFTGRHLRGSYNETWPVRSNVCHACCNSMPNVRQLPGLQPWDGIGHTLNSFLPCNQLFLFHFFTRRWHTMASLCGKQCTHRLWCSP